ncbi:SulP family inorganic anion transporter [Methylocystis echinoides]|uniref:Sulfate transporter n=1 Tax=Methylocystis echinoides TaxID=29468 RepID=A0A9W6GUJ7_9HYPH|nr:SulP family inorganic anion transporter [Methylocystis echinoides]GLI93373.1 sulfate transporter [Methylocystis echinoides]
MLRLKAPLARSLGHDAFASVVVFLVALPLSMGIAIASGVPMEKAASVGLVTAIIGGLVVGPLSGSPLQVSGPAAGLTVMVAAFIQKYGFETLGPIVMIGGLVQIVAGLLRLGPVFRAVSPALIQGMLAGIGVLIFASQFHVMVDDVPPGTGREFGGVINLWFIAEAVFKGVTEPVHRPAALIGLLTIAIVSLWAALAPKALRLVPAALLGVIAATAAASTFDLDVRRVPVPERLLDAARAPSLSDLDALRDSGVWLAGLSLAFVASAESLLTATAADSLQRHAERTGYSRELIAQGMGNLLCGLLNVLPLTGVIVRTSANVMAGARTRLSTFLHGAWMLLFVLLLPQLLSMIPVAALAAILVYTGAKLVKVDFAKGLWRQDRIEAIVFGVTFAGVVGFDLLTGILLGIGVSLARLVYTFSHLAIRIEKDEAARVAHVYPDGAATFIRLPRFAAALERIPPGYDAYIHLGRLTYIDHACLTMLVDWGENFEAAGGRLQLDRDILNRLFDEKVWRPANAT